MLLLKRSALSHIKEVRVFMSVVGLVAFRYFEVKVL